MASPTGRIRAFDWLRGLAVLFMLQTHSLVLLEKSIVGTATFNWLVRIDGLVAPSFIFAAGFALALVQVRGARTGAVKAQAKKSAKRIFEVLLVAELVNLAWFPIWREPKWLLRIDILHCIALSLFIALPLMVAFAKRPAVMRWVMLALAGVVFGLSPLFETTTGFASLFVNNQFGWLDATTGATFPLFPWSGYVFLGASAGATAAMGDERQLRRWLLLLWAIGAALWWATPYVRDAYPPHNFWVTNPANAGQRWAIVLTLVSAFRVVEVRWPAVAEWKVVKFLTIFGTSSLSAYFFHEMLLYFPTFRLFSFTMYWRGACGWPLFCALLAALIAMTYGLVRLWDKIDPTLRAWAYPESRPPT